jgi:acyl dehydratase
VFERFEKLVGLASEPVENVVERGAVRRFAEAIGDPNPAYTDEEAAKRSAHGRPIAPPTFPRTFEYGLVAGAEPPDLGLVHGEHRISYERPLFVGETVLCKVEVVEYSEKDARSGRLGFLVTERSGDAPGGERIFTMRDTVILTPQMRRAMEERE